MGRNTGGHQNIHRSEESKITRSQKTLRNCLHMAKGGDG